MNMNRGIYSKKSDMNEYDAIRRGFKTFPHHETPGLITIRKAPIERSVLFCWGGLRAADDRPHGYGGEEGFTLIRHGLRRATFPQGKAFSGGGTLPLTREKVG